MNTRGYAYVTSCCHFNAERYFIRTLDFFWYQKPLKQHHAHCGIIDFVISLCGYLAYHERYRCLITATQELLRSSMAFYRVPTEVLRRLSALSRCFNCGYCAFIVILMPMDAVGGRSDISKNAIQSPCMRKRQSQHCNLCVCGGAPVTFQETLLRCYGDLTAVPLSSL